MPDNKHANTEPPEPGLECPDSGRPSVVRRIFTRQRWSLYLLAIGIVFTLVGLLTAFSGFGLILLLFAPLWFAFSAILRPTRLRVALALFVLGCWAFGAFQVIT